MNLKELRRSLRTRGSPKTAAALRKFFKTGPGEYGEGDKFLGLKVPQVRALAKASDGLSGEDVLALLRSEWHEERLTALQIMVRRFDAAKRDESTRARLARVYLANTAQINNWDLVDASAPQLLGAWLLNRDRAVLDRLARSRNLWERRIAVVTTQAFIRAGQSGDTLRLVRGLLGDKHDLMHKACGWMLREVGKRDQPALARFLANHAPEMPRTMLRYAIERLPEAARLSLLRAPRLNSSVSA